MTTNPVTYSDILVELLAQNPTFSNYCGAIDNVFGPNIDFPISQLTNIRSLTQQDDIELRRSTLRMLGYDVTRDFITLNDNISQLPGYMFSLYYENAHSDDFWRFISYVLGRQVVVTELYTNDYVSFYEVPYGTLNINGGDWWKTTKVDVTVDIDGLGSRLITGPGETFQDRILELFYEYAPINLVVRNFLFSLTLNTTISFVGATLLDREMLYIGGDGIIGTQDISMLDNINILGSNTIIAGGSAKYKLALTWNQNISSWQYVTSIDSGVYLPPHPSCGQLFYLTQTDNGFAPYLYSYGEWNPSSTISGGLIFPSNPTDGEHFALLQTEGSYIPGVYVYSKNWGISTALNVGSTFPSNPNAESTFGLIQAYGAYQVGVYIYHNNVWVQLTSNGQYISAGATFPGVTEPEGTEFLLTTTFNGLNPGLYIYGQWALSNINAGDALPTNAVDAQEFYLLIDDNGYSSGLYIFSATWLSTSTPQGKILPFSANDSDYFFLIVPESISLYNNGQWIPLARGVSLPVGANGQYFYLMSSGLNLRSYSSVTSTWLIVDTGNALPSSASDKQIFYLNADSMTYRIGLYIYTATTNTWSSYNVSITSGPTEPTNPSDGQVFNLLLNVGLYKYASNWVLQPNIIVSQGYIYPSSPVQNQVFCFMGKVGLYQYSQFYTEVVEFNNFQTSSTLLSINSLGEATAQSPTQNQTATISALYGPKIASKDVTVIGLNSLVTEKSILILGPEDVNENTNQTFEVQIIWTNNTITTISATQAGGPTLEWYSLSPYINFSDSNIGSCTIETVPTTQTGVLVYLTYVGASGLKLNATKTVSINLVIGTDSFLTSISISGPGITPNKLPGTVEALTIGQDQSYQYLCTAHFSDSSVKNVLPLWYLQSTGGNITTGGLLTTYKNLTQTIMNLHATYEIRGITCTTVVPLRVVHTDNLFVDAQVISPGSTFLHLTQVQFYLNVIWSDGNNNFSNSVRADKWSTNRFYIDGNGLLTLGSVDSVQDGSNPAWIEVTAYFSYLGNYYSRSTTIGVVSAYPVLDFITIRGPTSIKGATQTNNTISGIALPSTPTKGQQFYLTESYVYSSVTYLPGYYIWSGSIWQLQSVQMVCYANQSDGSRSVVSLINNTSVSPKGFVAWSLDGNSNSFASIDSFGNLTLTNSVPTSEVITVNAHYHTNVLNYDIKGNSKQDYYASYYVAVITPVLTIDSISIDTTATIINGQISMIEMSREQFTVTVVYADGSTLTNVQPTWTILSTETQYAANDLARIDRKGNLTIRSLTAPTVILLQASYFGHYDQVAINLEQYNYSLKAPPYSAVIVGPTQIQPTDAHTQYAFYVTALAGGDPIALSATWALSGDPNVATVDYNGTVHLLAYKASVVTLTATYSCGYQQPVVATLDITLPQQVVSGVLTVHGSSVITTASTTNYSATIVDLGGNVVDVTANSNTVWSLANVDPNYLGQITLSATGLLTVPDIGADTTVRVSAVYTSNTQSCSGYLDVSILSVGAIYWVGPEGIGLNPLLSPLNYFNVSTPASSQSGNVIFIDLGPAEYGYYLSPISFGAVTFIGPTGIPGGWDGATWTSTSVSGLGPLAISLTRSGITTQYYLYRTDFPNIHNTDYTVNYS